MSISLTLYYLRWGITTAAWVLLFASAVIAYRRAGRAAALAQAIASGLVIALDAIAWSREFFGRFRHPPQWTLEAEVWVYTVALLVFAIGYWQIRPRTTVSQEKIENAG